MIESKYNGVQEFGYTITSEETRSIFKPANKEFRTTIHCSVHFTRSVVNIWISTEKATQHRQDLHR